MCLIYLRGHCGSSHYDADQGGFTYLRSYDDAIARCDKGYGQYRLCTLEELTYLMLFFFKLTTGV